MLRQAVRTHGGVNAAARALNIPITSFKTKLEQETGGLTKVLAIGDCHDEFGRCKRRFKWIGQYAADSDPDAIIQIGDWAGLKSLSAHESRGSKTDREAPTFVQDLESLEESLELFDEGCSRSLGIERYITLGNHEYRSNRAAENDPRHMQDAPDRLELIFRNRGWHVTPFMEWLFYKGVGFTHIPTNRMGRAVGGKNVGNTIGNDATHSIVYGHNHIYEFKPVPKLGLRNQIQILGLGTAMPDGMTEKYTPSTSPTGWSYGVVELSIDRLGNITDHQFVSMRELERRYA
jgi:predicted phosphodiesterase